MRVLHLNALPPEQLLELDTLYHTTNSIRVRTRAQIVLLAVEQDLIVPQIAAIVRLDENAVRRWLKRLSVLRSATGRLILLYLPTYSPWLNPIEMLWRHVRREVTHCELFENIHALIDACHEFFRRYNQVPDRVLSIIGAHPAVSL